MISVIICTWNRAHLLEGVFAGLEAQDQRAQEAFEVVVVDNNSSDNTSQVVERWASAWKGGRICYVHEGKQGKQFALNSGISAATGELLAFTDDDVVLPTNWLAQIHAVFSSDGVELCGGRTLIRWPSSIPPPWYRESMMAVLAGVDLGAAPLERPPDDYSPAGTCMIVRRSVFERIGKFSETHFRHMDYEFGQRALKAGVLVSYDPRLVVEAPADSRILSKQYFRRWYFKLGIAEARRDDGSRRLLDVPRWLWGELVRASTRALWLIASGRANEAFQFELKMWQVLGLVAARWHERLWSKSHAQWVERWSQKKGHTFG